SDIIINIGGSENIQSLTHCVTRLRFTFKDESKVNKDQIRKLEGVINAFDGSGQFQVVIGPAVTEVYSEAIKLIDTENMQTGTDASEPEKVLNQKRGFKAFAKEALDTLVACFVPTIPLLSGSGMIKVLAVLLATAGVLDASSSTYGLLNNVIGDGVLYFLPLFVAYNAAKKMKVDVFMAMAMALILVHPNFLAIAGDTGATSVSFFGLPVQLLDYSAQALPVIFGVWLLKYVDRFADRVSPNMIKIFLRPMIDLLVVVPVILIVVGPIALALGDLLLKFCAFMANWGWISVPINAVLFPLMVLTGTHNATVPLLVQTLATFGYDPIFLVSGMAANIAEGGAAAGVALRTKNKQLRSTAWSASLSAILGITEPALYGVNLRMKKPFGCMMVGSAIGGAIMGLVQLTAPTFVTPSVLTLPVFLSRCPNILLGILSVPITYIVTAAITYFVGFEDISAD
ncbi:MAG: PTS transporter subunit EIIC, partial [Bulleidia sp.]